ncbi:MAG: ABC transporter permease [Devosia sp.]
MSTDNTLADAIGKQTNKGFIAWMVSRQVFWIFLATIIAFIYLSIATKTFMTPQNLFNVTRNFSLVAIIAVGMTVVIIAGGIDLTVGATLLMAAMVTGVVMAADVPLWQAVILAMLASLGVGLANGLLIAVAGMPPFVVTLGMMSVVRSLALVLSNNKLISDFGPDQELLYSIGGGSQTIDFSFLQFILPQAHAIPFPNPVMFMVVVALVTGFLLRWTQWGRWVFAIGGNEKAAILTGIPVKTVKVSVYMYVAFCAGLSGFLEIGWLGTVTANQGFGRELIVIAASVIGGANLVGGIGTAFGAVVGSSLIEVIRNSLTLLGINSFWQGTFVGAFIILAVSFDRLRNKETSE